MATLANATAVPARRETDWSIAVAAIAMVAFLIAAPFVLDRKSVV